MNSPHPLLESLGWTLLHSIWIGGLIGAAGLLCRLGLAQASASVRYSYDLVLLVLLALCPLVVFGKLDADPPLAGPAPLESAPSLSQPPPLVPQPLNGESLPRTAADFLPIATASSPAMITPPANHWITLLPLAWGGGVLAMSAYLVFGLFATARLGSAARSLSSETILAEAQRIAGHLGLRRRFAVALSERIASPLVLGAFQPMILLPAALVAGLDRRDLEMILHHELHHIRRYDNAVIVGQRVVECVLFFQPFVWVFSRLADRERERACDAATLRSSHVGRREYATLLLRLNDSANAIPLGAAAMARHDLVGRVRHLLLPSRTKCTAAAFAVFPLAALLGCVLLLSHVDLGIAEEENPAEAKAEPLVTRTYLWDATPPLAWRPDHGTWPPDPASLLDQSAALRRYLEDAGLTFPPGTGVAFDAATKRLILRQTPTHLDAAHRALAAALESRVALPNAQVLLVPALVLRREGREDLIVETPSVVTRFWQPARIETRFVGIEMHPEITKENALRVHGSFEVRCVSGGGGSLAGFFAEIEHDIKYLLSSVPLDPIVPAIILTADFDSAFVSGEPVELKYDGDVPGGGSLFLRLTATPIDPSGGPTAIKPFGPLARPDDEDATAVTPADAAEADRLLALAEGYEGLGYLNTAAWHYFAASRLNPSAGFDLLDRLLAAGPELWKDRPADFYDSDPPADDGTLVDYAFPTGLSLAGEFGNTLESARAALEKRGIAFPEGARANCKGNKLIVRNTRKNLDFVRLLLRGLLDRQSIRQVRFDATLYEVPLEAAKTFGSGWISVAEPPPGPLPPGAEPVDEAPPSPFRIGGVFTEPQRASVEKAFEQGGATLLLDGKPRILPKGSDTAILTDPKTPDAWKGITLQATSDELGYAIEVAVNLDAPAPFQTAITIWSGQTLMLRGPGKDGAPTLLLLRLTIADGEE